MPSESAPGTKHAETLAIVLSLVPSFFVARPIIARMPLGHDHATHVFKAWHFWTELVPSGRLRGWSHFWGFGFPSDELVPCGGEVWVGLFRLLTLGQLSWVATYAVAFAALMVLKSYAAFRFARHFFGRAAGVIAAWLTLLDPGAMLEGGWEWHTTWGVWPVTLAACCFELALVRLDRVLSGSRARDVALAGALSAAALLTHQIALVAFALTVPFLFADRRLRPAPPAWPAYARALGALLLGASLVAFFLVPFFTHTADTLDLGWLHEPFSVVVERLFDGKIFQNFALPFHVLGLVGIAVALFRRPPGGIFFAVSALGCVLLASDVLVRTLHLERVLPSLVKLEVNRLLLVAKLFWFPLIGYALVELVRWGKRALSRAGLGPPAVHVLLVLALAAPFSLPSVQRLVAEQAQKKVTGAARLPDWADLQQFLTWSRGVREQSQQHYRTAFELWRGNHLPTVSPVFDRTPLYKAGTTPTQIFKNLPRAPGDHALYEAMSVKYVVALEASQEPSLRLVAQFGSLFVHEFARYRPEPFRVLGPGRAELLEFSPERIRLRLSGSGPDTRVKLHVASYSRWRATQAGRELPIATVPVYAFVHPILMEVPARDGELSFEYVRRPADWLGLCASLLAVPGFLAALWLGRERRGLVLRAAGAVERNLGLLGLASVVVLASLVGGAALRTKTRRAILPPDSIFHELKTGELSFAGKACQKVEPLVFQCGQQRVEAEAVSSAIWGVHLCMHAPRSGPVLVETSVELGSFLAGSYDSVTRESSGSIEVAVSGQPVARFATAPAYLQQQFVQFDTRARRGQTAKITLRLDGSAVDCFDFRIVR